MTPEHLEPGEISPIEFCRLSKRPDVFEMRIRRDEEPPFPPVHYCRVVSAGPFERLIVYLMFNGARECWALQDEVEDRVRDLFEWSR